MFELTPSPATDHVDVVIIEALQTHGQIFIHDQLGKKLLLHELRPGENWINFDLEESRYPPGVYYVTMVMDIMMQTRRLMVVR